MTPNLSVANRAALYNPQCYSPSEATPGSVGGAVDCANYLTGLGSKDCHTDGNTVMCSSGRTIVRGIALGADSATSSCQDVAIAVGWVLDNCPACGGDDCNIAGIWDPSCFVGQFLLSEILADRKF